MATVKYPNPWVQRMQAMYEAMDQATLNKAKAMLVFTAQQQGSNPTIKGKLTIIMGIQKKRKAAEDFLKGEQSSITPVGTGTTPMNVQGTVTGRFSSHQHVGTTKHSAVTQLQAYEYLNRMLPKVNPK